MNRKKRNVVDKAQELFVERGYHATSIQDILERSGISKGSFYNYFSSKSELFKAVYNLIQDNLIMERDKLLIGKDRDDREVFIEQMIFVMGFYRENKFEQLIEDAMVSSDPDLIKFIKQSRYFFINWFYERFIHIFPEDKSKYLPDCAVIFSGMLQNTLYINTTLNKPVTRNEIVRYCLERIIVILEDVSQKNINLFTPNNLNQLLSKFEYNHFFNNDFSIATMNLKKVIEKSFNTGDKKMMTYLDLLLFVQEEVMKNAEETKKFLIESALSTLKSCEKFTGSSEYVQYVKVLEGMGYCAII